MSEEAINQTAEAPQGPPPMPPLPDGLGMSYEEVKAALAEKNHITVDMDDPLLMQVTICNAFLTHQHAMLERHKTGIAQLLADKTSHFVSGVNEVVNSLGESLKASTVQQMQQVFSEHQTALQVHQNNMRWLSAIAVVSALVNVGVFVCLYLLGR